ncbi:MAG: class II D-tagatose-bisphosphate aldolase, non-catalytic subunit [Oscillospiraceae bacterium]|nr:class II D-tagatose-bisphosphate aldolase, non-catalytic subunit [Oscillospiraceae bacterium]
MFNTVNFFSELISESKAGKGTAICSVCSSSSYVIAAAIRHCKKTGRPLLVEATANQVNQYGGYTGMRPKDYIGFVNKIAGDMGFDPENIIFGGDHLGPLVWCEEYEDAAMAKAEELVSEYAAAGFGKIHLDCSMRLGSDSKTAALSPSAIAGRAARLARICESNLPEKRRKPVYVVGSEVPIPGGATSHEDMLAVTDPESMREELKLFEAAFLAEGLDDAWKRVIAIVVQPGVEFGNNQVFLYDHGKAEKLAACAAGFENIVMEGHSTDYQPDECLDKMKHDGIAILKVGPALTFAMRNALFALEEIEKTVCSSSPSGLSDFSETLENAMLKNPKNWIKHYTGDDKTLAIMRKFSLSDRCRYYMDDESVREAIARLFANINKAEIPMGVIAQFFPRQCLEIVSGELKPTAENLVYRQIEYVLDTYA